MKRVAISGELSPVCSEAEERKARISSQLREHLRCTSPELLRFSAFSVSSIDGSVSGEEEPVDANDSTSF